MVNYDYDTYDKLTFINSHSKDSKFTLDVGLVDENFTCIHTHIYI